MVTFVYLFLGSGGDGRVRRMTKTSVVMALKNNSHLPSPDARPMQMELPSACTRRRRRHLF